jgi:CubicO group peptidase (beta-lactamase class C family)
MRRITTICFLSLAAVGFLAARSINGQINAPAEKRVEKTRLSDAAEFAAWADGFFAEQFGGSPMPGLGLVVVKDGGVFFQKGYGRARDENDAPPAPERTVFRAASVSKLVTATAMMQLVEQGKINLDTDINTYLTRFQLENNFPAPVTVRHLLTHTSGIEDRLFGNTVPSANQLVSLGSYFAARVPRRIRPPGERIAYSNTGMALAGHLVEAVSGLSFEEYVERNIFAPLGMTRSSFRQPYPAHLAAEVVPSGADAGALLLYPSGSMIGTVSDMGRFLAAHLDGGKTGGGARILSAETVVEMHRRQFSAHRNMPGVALGFFENYTNGRRALFHTGLSGHQSLLCLLPEENVGFYIVLSTRQGGAQQDLRRKFMQAFLDRYFPATPESSSLPSPPKDFAARAARFTGLYRPNLFPRATIETLANMAADTRVSDNGDGTLTVSLPLGAKTFRVVETEPMLFKSEDGFRFAFGEDADGGINRLDMSGSIVDPVSFERLKWYQSGTLHAGLSAAGFFVFLSFCFVSLTGFICRFFRRTNRGETPNSRSSRSAWAAAFLASALVVLSPAIALVWYFAGDPEQRPYKIEAALYAALAVLHLAALLGLTLPIFAFKAWKYGYWSLPRRVYFSLAALAAVLMTPFFYYWNLLGFRF